VFAAFNFSPRPLSVALKETLFVGDYQDFETGAAVSLKEGDALALKPWGYRVLVKTP